MNLFRGDFFRICPAPPPPQARPNCLYYPLVKFRMMLGVVVDGVIAHYNYTPHIDLFLLITID